MSCITAPPVQAPRHDHRPCLAAARRGERASGARGRRSARGGARAPKERCACELVGDAARETRGRVRTISAASGKELAAEAAHVLAAIAPKSKHEGAPGRVGRRANGAGPAGCGRRQESGGSPSIRSRRPASACGTRRRAARRSIGSPSLFRFLHQADRDEQVVALVRPRQGRRPRSDHRRVQATVPSRRAAEKRRRATPPTTRAPIAPARARTRGAPRRAGADDGRASGAHHPRLLARDRREGAPQVHLVVEVDADDRGATGSRHVRASKRPPRRPRGWRRPPGASGSGRTPGGEPLRRTSGAARRTPGYEPLGRVPATARTARRTRGP